MIAIVIGIFPFALLCGVLALARLENHLPQVEIAEPPVEEPRPSGAQVISLLPRLAEGDGSARPAPAVAGVLPDPIDLSARRDRAARRAFSGPQPQIAQTADEI